VGAEPPIAQECVEGYVFVPAPFSLLVLRRPPKRGSIWVPVSGKVDPTDRDYPAALRRELVEETGFPATVPLRPLDWHVVFDGPTGEKWRLHAFGVELDAKWAPHLSDEHDAFQWVTAQVALERLHYRDNREAVERLLARLSPGPPPP
jgi:8-oxo-dGTP pyrophosphatase MutT (NUDIX family)